MTTAKFILFALLLCCCSGPGADSGDWDVRGKPGDRIDLVCETMGRCYAAANEVCWDRYDLLCIKRHSEDPCDVGPEPGIHMLIECR